MWKPNQTIKNDRFLIQEVLGGGGFGIAYRALDRKNNHQVVIKTLNQRQQNQADFEQLQEKFVNEAMVLKGFHHPHIVKVYELIQENSLWGMVMEYIDGQELAAYIERQNKLTEQQALGYIDQVGKALLCVHQEEILHRDIKPHNIILRAGNREAVLIDFGLARGFIDGRTVSMTDFHTHGYAPIEQYDRHGHFGTYTDVYALAATLYHIVTGEAPTFNAKGRWEAQEKGQSIDHFLWDKIPQGVSKQTKQAIVRGMAVLPQDRPQTMGEFLQLLGLGVPAVQFSTSNIPKLTKIQFTSVKLNDKGDIIDKPIGTADILTQNLGKGVELIMVRIPTGKFSMGSPVSEEDRLDSENPQHQVSVPEFYLGQTLITQVQWQITMGNNPSRCTGNDKLPVEQVSWLEAMDFCEKLSQKTGSKYCLPSEAQWEYACRAGTTTPFAFGETVTPAIVNYNGNYQYQGAESGEYRGKTTPVNTFPPNLFGLSDMHGNLWEWCLDEWAENYHGAPTDGTARGNIISKDKYKARLMRGGSWSSSPRYCRSATRSRLSAESRSNYIGFRVVVV